VGAVVAVVLIPDHDITGAAWALATATTVQTVVFSVQLLRVLKTSTPTRRTEDTTL
jgi:Na+-driven multidrug efflux pump